MDLNNTSIVSQKILLSAMSVAESQQKKCPAKNIAGHKPTFQIFLEAYNLSR